MPARVPRPAQDWCDVNGTSISLFCQVEQIADSAECTVLPSWLHEQGQVVGRGRDALYVCFPGNQVISLRPELVRVLDAQPSGD